MIQDALRQAVREIRHCLDLSPWTYTALRPEIDVLLHTMETLQEALEAADAAEAAAEMHEEQQS